MLNGYFKNRVLAWSKEEAGAEPVVVQVRGKLLLCPPTSLAALLLGPRPGARLGCPRCSLSRTITVSPCLQAEVGDPHR